MPRYKIEIKDKNDTYRRSVIYRDEADANIAIRQLAYDGIVGNEYKILTGDNKLITHVRRISPKLVGRCNIPSTCQQEDQFQRLETIYKRGNDNG